MQKQSVNNNINNIQNKQLNKITQTIKYKINTYIHSCYFLANISKMVSPSKITITIVVPKYFNAYSHSLKEYLPATISLQTLATW